jgi:hypothetical protein
VNKYNREEARIEKLRFKNKEKVIFLQIYLNWLGLKLTNARKGSITKSDE